MKLTAELALQANLGQLKELLQIPYVMERYGYEPDFIDADGKLHYVNPFREDTRPSLDVFPHIIANRDKPEARWGDFAEGTQGDVVDLIQRFEPDMTRAAAIDHARTLLRAQVLSGWDGPTVSVQEREPFDEQGARALLDRGLPLAVGTAWDELVHTRPALRGVDVPLLAAHPDLDAIMFPVFDRDDQLVGIRFRRADGAKFSYPGSRNALLRMGLPQPDKPVLLVEGETDTWSAWGWLGEGFEVLGVPGVGNQPATLAGDELDGRDVYLAFDPDRPGIEGMQRWIAYLRGRGCAVFPIILPEDKDVAGLQPDQVRALPSQARAFMPAPEGLSRSAGVFTTTNKDGDPVPVANWSFTPTRRLRGEDGTTSYRGDLYPHGREVVLPASALRGGALFQAWMNQYELAWFGTANHLQLLIALLAHEGTFLPEGRYTTQFGLTDGTFVWNGGRVGPASVEYLPPEHASSTAGRFNLPAAPVDRVAVFKALYGLQAPEVMGPILAWMAVAPLRTRFDEFPILSVSGASGTGKTTLLEAISTAFFGGIPSMNLTSSTPYGVESFVDASNGLPVWIDEYRPGARAEAKLRLDQLLRDIFTGQSSLKGGVSADRLKVREIRTTAPVIVSGEDRFTETSHVDRMVLLRLTKGGQGDLRALDLAAAAGWGRAYLGFLTVPDPREHEPDPPVYATPWLDSRFDDRLHSRQALTMSVLRYGWLLLTDFVTDFGRNGFDMPELQLEGVVDEAIEEGSESPVLELIRLAYENSHNLRYPAVWQDEDAVLVSSANLLKAQKEFPHIILPVSSARGITSLLVDAHGGTTARRYMPFGGRQARVVVLPRAILEQDDSAGADE